MSTVFIVCSFFLIFLGLRYENLLLKNGVQRMPCIDWFDFYVLKRRTWSFIAGMMMADQCLPPPSLPLSRLPGCAPVLSARLPMQSTHKLQYTIDYFTYMYKSDVLVFSLDSIVSFSKYFIYLFIYWILIIFLYIHVAIFVNDCLHDVNNLLCDCS